MANDYKKIEENEEAFQKFLKNFVIATLRRATYRWPFKNMAKNLKRVERGLYSCQVCSGTFSPKEINLDHIIPVIDPFKGFTDWNDFINRLFIKTEGFQVLCELCHSNKSVLENVIRVQNGQKAIKHRNKLTKAKKKVKIK